MSCGDTEQSTASALGSTCQVGRQGPAAKSLLRQLFPGRLPRHSPRKQEALWEEALLRGSPGAFFCLPTPTGGGSGSLPENRNLMSRQ